MKAKGSILSPFSISLFAHILLIKIEGVISFVRAGYLLLHLQVYSQSGDCIVLPYLPVGLIGLMTQSEFGLRYDSIGIWVRVGTILRSFSASNIRKEKPS